MSRKLVGLLGGLGVNLALAAASDLVKSDVLLYAGIIGLALTAVLWLWSWAFAPPKDDAAEVERRSRRRKIINDAQGLVAKFELQARYDWRQMVRYSPEFAPVRPHLSQEYLAQLNDTSTVHVQGGLLDPLAEGFLDELDRLEREWKLS